MKVRRSAKRQSAIVALAIVALLLPLHRLAAQGHAAAWERWGVTKSSPDPAAEPLLSAAYRLFYDQEFDSALLAYERLVKSYPDNVEAHVGRSMALRYQDQQDEALAECEKALAMDPDAVAANCNYADLIAPLHHAKPSEPLNESGRLAASIAHNLKAAGSNHRYSAYAHTGLWVSYMGSGQLAKARAEMRALWDKDYFPTSLKEFGWNLLVGLAPDAILFTDGDNDTYPLWAVQENEGFRRDAVVVNLSLLNVAQATAMLRDSLRLPVSYADHDPPPAFRLVADIIANARKQGRPVYFATTVYEQSLGEWKDYRVLEGLAWRVGDKAAKDSVDMAHVIENMTVRYRLKNAGRKEDWAANMSPITRGISALSINYVALYLRMAAFFKGKDDMAKVNEYCGRAFEIVDGLDLTQWRKQLVVEWHQLAPDNPRATELWQQYK
jgi:hypothetical protein